MKYTPVEEYLAKWLCDAIGTEPEKLIWVAVHKSNGRLFRIPTQPTSKAEAEADDTKAVYDRGDAPLPAWQAFIEQARESTSDLVVVSRTQLTAVQQCRFIAEGMTDKNALTAARDAVKGIVRR